MQLFALPKSRVNKLGCYALLLAFCLGLIAPAAKVLADDATADLAKVQATLQQKPDLSKVQMALGKYEYAVSWEGIPAADASVSISREGERYRMVVSARTYSGIDIFYKMRYRAEGLMSANDLQPIKTLIDQRENSTQKNTQIEFLSNGSIRSVRSRNGEDVSVTTLEGTNFTLDPLSAGLMARALDWKVGDTHVFDAFNGKTRYVISLTAEKEEWLRVNGEQRKVWVIVPQVKLFDSNQAHKKLRRARIYVTADDKREILKIVSSVFIGSVTTELEAFTPLLVNNQNAEQVKVAMRERVLIK